MKKERKEDHFIKKPLFPGGLKEMRRLISKNLKYPKEALKHQIEGTVIIKYEIDYRGSVKNTKIISGIGYGCDEEAIRIIKLLKFQVPKNPRKLKIKFHKTTRIHFILPKQKTANDQRIPLNLSHATLAYHIIPSPEKKQWKSKTSYSYTIQTGGHG